MKAIWEAIKRFFGANKGDSEGTTPIPTPSNPSTPSIPSTSGSKKIAILRGHGGGDSGATGNGTSEVEYNTWVMQYIEANTPDNVKCFYGSSSMDAVNKSLGFSPDITIQLHLNSYNGSAKGCEVLVIDGDTKSYAIAESFADAFTKKFNRVKRRPEANGKKLLDSSDRGVASLKATKKGIKILVEPFFIDNKNEIVPREEYAKFFVEWLKSV